MKLVKVLSLFLLLLPAKTLPNNSLDIPFFNYLHTSYTLLNNSVDYAWKSVCDHPYFTASITVGLCVFIPLACKLYRNYTYKLNSKINIHSTPKPIISKPTTTAPATLFLQQQAHETEKELFKDKKKLLKRRTIKLLVKFIEKHHFNSNKFAKHQIAIKSKKFNKICKIILKIRDLLDNGDPQFLREIQKKTNKIAIILRTALPFNL
jgi:hypothetical protein